MALAVANIAGLLTSVLGSTAWGVATGFGVSAVLLLTGVTVERLPRQALKPGDKVFVLMGLEDEKGVVESVWGRPDSPTVKVALEISGPVDVPIGAVRLRGPIAVLRRLA